MHVVMWECAVMRCVRIVRFDVIVNVIVTYVIAIVNVIVRYAIVIVANVIVNVYLVIVM